MFTMKAHSRHDFDLLIVETKKGVITYMYARILKKDLKRKRTMNVILLLFVVLAGTFISSSVNNIITVRNAIDDYFEKAGAPDFVAATMEKMGGRPISEILDGIEVVEGYQCEPMIYLNGDTIFYEGEKDHMESVSTPMLIAVEEAKMKYFDTVNDQVLEQVEPGEIYVVDKFFQGNNFAVGDTLEICLGDVSRSFRIAGSFKDAIGGSRMMGFTRFIVSEEDFELFLEDPLVATMYTGNMIYLDTMDEERLSQELNDNSSGIVFTSSTERLKMSYVMDMVVAGVLLVVSICLILIAFVVLHFVISFTISEEYREIGVMKAIGISDLRIRSFYMIKYLMIAVLGAVIGFFASIPFGDMMLQTVSQSMVVDRGGNRMINLLSSVLLILIILGFCYGCTGKIKKFTPVDAIRSGTTGERFQKKGLLRLNRSHLHPTVFLAANDVCSSPRRFGVVTLVFGLSMSLVLILVITVSTLQSDALVTSFGILETDVYYVNEGFQKQFMVEDGRTALVQELERMETTLRDHGIPAECMVEAAMNLTLVYEDKVHRTQVLQGVGTKADQYTYYEGTPPQNSREIALTLTTAEQLGAEIGDTVILCQAEGDQEYVITAYFQSMNNMGEGARLHESAQADFRQVMGFFPFQIRFTDDPDSSEIKDRMEVIKEIYDTDTVYSAGEYVERLVGVAGTLNRVKFLVLLVVLIIILFVTVLMERSFIAKEQGEIAILKAMGFRSGTIIAWHSIRFGIVSVIATMLSLLLIRPLTELSVGPVFRMMGAEFGVKYEILPLEVYVIYPCIVLAVTMAGACLTALYTKKIKASETSGME